MVNSLDVAGVFDLGLRASYELCDKVHAAADPDTHHLVRTYLPAPKHPHFHALHAYFAATEDISDDCFADWVVETLQEVAEGRSDHRLRQAFVHTVVVWGLDVAVLREFLEAIRLDRAAPPRCATFDDLRGFLRGAGGAPARLTLPLFEPLRPAAHEMSLLGEVFRLLDVCRGYGHDLRTGRCYLPDEPVDVVVRRARLLVEEGTAVLDLVHPSSRPFLEMAIAGYHLGLDEVEGTVPPRVDGREESTSDVPRHVAVIMDDRGRSRPAGERALLDVVEGAAEIGLRFLSVFAFSTRHRVLPSDEVGGLADVVARVVRDRVEWLHTRGIRLVWAGRRDRIPADLRAALEAAERRTGANTRLTLVLCLDYGGRAEIVHAARRLVVDAVAGRVDVDAVGERDFGRYLYAPDVPEVDLLIRTSGEQRISNFLLWQGGYAEILFTDALWPDFDRRALRRAVDSYACRDRRFGGVPDQRARAVPRGA
ncbi:polyprenyl diphosphate synthase [Umezawaea sp. NPDC059074]|uniref:polyprenyl diphosphate synthase n=1 Tax=Umezawaea sp. NPDC059074 TaxID=3346716 RepID=UPI0036A5BEE0